MGAPINRIESWTASDYDMIIDVRSPAEFADDHLPGAVNLPVLDNDQRAEIGTMYKQISPFAAKRAGAALVAGNIARHIGSALKDADRNFRPLVYCWRGGQRSGAMAGFSARSDGRQISSTVGINVIANRCLMASTACPIASILLFCGGALDLPRRIFCRRRWPRCTGN